ncbi:MAG: hypothetical protein GY944_23965 [bacterium]|nr:hypothetical protein [bacterium]MCP5044096.1 hypothetical protein [bacterium]
MPLDEEARLRPRSITSRSGRALATVVVGFALFRVLGEGTAQIPTHQPLPATWSLFALGDTGKVHRFMAGLFEGQLAVGADLMVEDRNHRADALLLLGDNFYMRGLRSQELVPRIVDNLVLPYCGFVELGGPRSQEVAHACRVDRGRRPIWAVLGNHDHLSRESPALQRDAIPAYVSNWELSTDFVVVRESGAGVSLVLFDSTRVERGEVMRSALVQALRAARGPWRILVSHAPIAVGDAGGEPVAGSVRGEFERWVGGAIEQAAVQVHLHLAGHHHSLQLVDGVPGFGPALHAVVGSGSRRRPIRDDHRRRRFASERLGFARVDLVGHGANARLVVSMFESPRLPLLRFGGPRLAARVAVTLEGELARVD